MSEEPEIYKTKPLKKGTYVSRSAYSKLQAENKALKKDIYILCHEKHAYTAERVMMTYKYRRQYEAEERFKQMLKELAMKHIAENPDCFAAQLIREFPPKKGK